MRSAATDGRLLLDGEAVQFGSPREALDQGVAFIAQELALAPDMTVMENVFLGVEPRHGSFVDRGAMRSSFDALAGVERLHGRPATPGSRSLSIADQQKVEILRALGRGASVIIMDEPTSSLTRDESQRLHALIRDLSAGGMTIVYVSHFLDEVLALSDDITILRNGRLIRTGPASAETEATLVTGDARAMPHRPTTRRASPPPPGAPLLQVDGLSRAGFLHDVSLTVAAGEIVGLAGLVGSGRSELARAIFGADPVDGRHDHGRRRAARRRRAAPSPSRRPGDAAREPQGTGAAAGPAGRGEHDPALPRVVAADRPVRLAVEGQRARRRPRAARRPRREARSPKAMVKTMSGGNQQKVLFGKCLFQEPRILILDEPTRGVDVGARHAIHNLIGSLAARGVGIILISSDLEEVLGLAHRVLVMRRGAIVAEFGADPSMDAVMEAAFGVAPAGVSP